MRLKLLLFSPVVVIVVWLAITNWPVGGTSVCKFTALDVGQGDAILIQTPDGQDMLVDGGPDDRVINELGDELGPGNREIELVVLTHPDDDHITGLVSVLDRFSVRQILASDVSAPTEIYDAWQEKIKSIGAPFRYVISGEKYQLGDYLTIDIIWPPADHRSEVNDMSVMMKVECAGSTALLTGDASSAVEERLAAGGIDLHASLLKVGHHGSRTSSAHEFLKAVNPDLAVISVGIDNKFNHPHPATLRRLKTLKIKVYRTDKMGAVTLYSAPGGGWRLST